MWQKGRFLCIAAALLAHATIALGAFTFTPGDFYSTDTSSDAHDSSINEYSPAGNLVGTITLRSEVASYGLRRLAFGPDSLLYVVAMSSPQRTSAVLALDSSGVIQHTYTVNIFFANASYGNLVVD